MVGFFGFGEFFFLLVFFCLVLFWFFFYYGFSLPKAMNCNFDLISVFITNIVFKCFNLECSQLMFLSKSSCFLSGKEVLSFD